MKPIFTVLSCLSFASLLLCVSHYVSSASAFTYRFINKGSMICAHPVNLWITFLYPVFVEISEAEIALALDFDNDLDLRTQKTSFLNDSARNDPAYPLIARSA